MKFSQPAPGAAPLESAGSGAESLPPRSAPSGRAHCLPLRVSQTSAASPPPGAGARRLARARPAGMQGSARGNRGVVLVKWELCAVNGGGLDETAAVRRERSFDEG